eukprot:gene6418-10426_t
MNKLEAESILIEKNKSMKSIPRKYYSHYDYERTMILIITRNPYEFPNCSKRLLQDESFIKKVIKKVIQNKGCYKIFKKIIKNDLIELLQNKEMATILICHFPSLLKYSKFKEDEVFVKQFIGIISIKHFSKKIRQQKESIIKAIEIQGMSIIKYLDQEKYKEVENNYENLIKFIRLNGLNLQYCSENQKNDPFLIKIAIEKCPKAIQFISVELQNNVNFIIECVNINPQIFVHLSKKMKNCQQILLEAIKYSAKYANGVSLSYEVLNTNGMCLKYFKKGYYPSSEIHNILAVENNGFALKHVDIQEKEIVEKAIKNQPLSFKFAMKEFKSDKKLIEIAIKGNEKNFQFLIEKDQNDEMLILKLKI